MKRVLVLSATPRRGGNSDILADRVAAGAQSVGAEVEKVRLADRRIDPCDACNACQSSRDAPCIVQDGMEDLYPKLRAADAIVFATPIYFFTVSGQMKCFVDRTYALGGGGDWTALQGKRVGLVFTYGDPDVLRSGVANAYGMFRDACMFLGMELVDCVHAACGDAGEVLRNQSALAAAAALGKSLATG